MIDELRELANLLDDHGKPSMSVDSMRRDIVSMKARLTANDNNQPGKNT